MIQILKKYLLIGVLLSLIFTSLSTYFLYKERETLQKNISVLKENEKAFISENLLLEESNRTFKFTIEQLNYYNDSIIKKLTSVKNELRIKDKDLKQMQYLLSVASKRDTITFRDTLFKNPSLNVDTIIEDKWYKLKLELKYPSTIISSPGFISEKYIITNYKKETINPPKKCWLLRLFQKKHKVVEVNIVEKNPYIENKQQRFIEIIE